MITLIAKAQSERGEVRTATLTCSVATFERDQQAQTNLVRAWFCEDHPDIPSDAVIVVEVHRG